jgi:S1-C subfamily serine protease
MLYSEEVLTGVICWVAPLVPMRTSLWLTPLLALMATSQAYQAWETSRRLRTLETKGAWAAENERIEDQQAVRLSERSRAQARELRELKGQLQNLGDWRSELDSFAAAARTSQRTLREEIRRSLASVSNTQPASAEQDFARITATLSSCEDRLNSTDGELSDLRERLQSTRFPSVEANAPLDETATRWHKLMGPAVQLSGGGTVGSAVLLPSESSEGEWRTQLLTAWHVVRDIRLGLGEDALIPVTLYNEDGSSRHEEAKLLCRDATIDIALLELTSTGSKLPGAQLASRTALAKIKVFEDVYAVGCPLGNDPIPTHGKLSDTSHVVEGTTHWMISAPTYIGNSGGGIFHAESEELVGIFSKLYTHGSLRPTVVPHMGLAIPLVEVYEWLEGEGYASLVPDHAEPVMAAATSR